MECRENASRLHTFIKDIIPTPPGISFPRPAWVRLNCLRTGVGLFRSETHKWGMASTDACMCGAKEQTVEHIITSCPINYHPKGARALSDVGKSLETWLNETCPEFSGTSCSLLSPTNKEEKIYKLPPIRLQSLGLDQNFNCHRVDWG